jgi:hypothetical protein
MFEKHAEGVLVADGTEQVILEIAEPTRISGYVSLKAMSDGDVVVIRQYVSVDGKVYELYAQETFTGVQENPIVYVRPKELASATKVTLQQVAGTFKTYHFVFVKEQIIPTQIFVLLLLVLLAVLVGALIVIAAVRLLGSQRRG